MNERLANIGRSIESMIYLNHRDQDDRESQIPEFREVPWRITTHESPSAPPLSLPPVSDNVADRILQILLSGNVRRGSRRLIESHLPVIRQQIARLVEYHQPISFVLPTLPFNDQSPFTTAAPIDHVDMGEYALFAQMQRIVQAIGSIYEPGAHMTLLCDGYVYADIFASGDVDGAGQYRARCEQLRNEYGLINHVTLFDMREVLFDMPEWREVESQFYRDVRSLMQQSAEVRQRIATLQYRMRYHVGLQGVSYEEARILYSNDSLPQSVRDILEESSLRYISLLLTLRETNLVQRAFPSAIRCTVHPKNAPQLPVHLTKRNNQLLPYNGVATVSRRDLSNGQSLFQALRTRRISEVLQYPNPMAVYTPQAEHPYYYEVD